MMRAERRYRGWCWLAAGLLVASAPAVAADDDDGRALIAAVRAQDAEASRALLGRGAAVDAVQPDGADGPALGGVSRRGRARRPANRRRCRRRRGERLRRDAARFGVRQRRRGDGGQAAGGGRRPEPSPRQRRDPGHDLRPDRLGRGRARAPRPRRRPVRGRAVARPDRPHVGGRRGACGRGARPDRARRGCRGPLERRLHGAADRRPRGRSGPRRRPRRGGGGRERRGPRRHHAAARRGGARPRRARDGAARARGGSERGRPRLYRPALGGGVVAHRADRPPARHRHGRRPRVAFAQRRARRQAGPSSTRCWPTGPTPTSGSAATRPSSASRASASG